MLDARTAYTEASIKTEDVAAQITAAYACEEEGQFEEAVRCYDRAWVLGIPIEGRKAFLTGYGAALRHVGRLEDSAEVLAQALEEFGDSEIVRVQLALTLRSLGRADDALAVLLDLVLLNPQGSDELTRYTPAIRHYRDGLLEGRDDGPEEERDL